MAHSPHLAQVRSWTCIHQPPVQRAGHGTGSDSQRAFGSAERPTTEPFCDCLIIGCGAEYGGKIQQFMIMTIMAMVVGHDYPHFLSLPRAQLMVGCQSMGSGREATGRMGILQASAGFPQPDVDAAHCWLCEAYPKGLGLGTARIPVSRGAVL